jgi:glycosyltransferase involved in cell wall biosynthesis
VIQNDGTQKDCARILEGAKIVAVPIRADNICSSSIGTYLNAMYFGKPCVLTSGPGVSDVLTDQALIVPPGDARKLREAIQVLLTDDKFRSDLAGRGRRYAESLGGVEELGSRVRDEVMRWWYRERKNSISRL